MKIRILIIIAAVFFGFSSCMDILDTSPYNQVASVGMWTTESLTDMGVNGIYSNLRNWGIYGTGISLDGNSNGMGQWGFEILGPLGMSHNVADFLNGGLNPGSGNVNTTWRRLYEGVHRANEAILNIPLKSPCTEEKKARLVAEAIFLRAFHYYRLNELWRGVPYYDEPVLIEECIKARETEDFIWEKIIEDLNTCIAEPNFPNNDFQNGRVTKGCAYALRGKVYMQQGKWSAAIADFQKVGECGYGLFQGDYKELFTVANERCNEMIFSIQNIAQPNMGSIAQQYLGTRSAQGSCWGDHQITIYAAELYENADGTPFNWDDYIAGYTSLPLAEREIYFIRDREDAEGSEFHANITSAITTRLDALEAIKPGISATYLPYGNQARIRTAYDNRDPRFETIVVTPYSQFRGIAPDGTTEFTYTYRWPYVMNATPITGNYVVGDFQPDYTPTYLYHQRKFVFEGYNGPTFDRTRGDIDDPIIRYADVLLMWAEALVEQNSLTEAMTIVQQVRDRVNMPTLAANFADQATARNYVRDERRREMLGEGGGFFDELRWGTLKASKYEASKYGEAVSRQIWGIVGRGSTFRWPDLYTGDKMVWPIPRGEIEMNSNLQPTTGWTY